MRLKDQHGFILEEVDGYGKKIPEYMGFHWLSSAVAYARSQRSRYGYGWEGGVFVVTLGVPRSGHLESY